MIPEMDRPERCANCRLMHLYGRTLCGVCQTHLPGPGNPLDRGRACTNLTRWRLNIDARPEFWQGNTACAEGALAAGCNFFGGYPITPSTEIAEHMAVKLPKRNGVFIQMEDEIAWMASIIGASWTDCPGDDRDQRAWIFAHDGEHRVCGHDRNPLRDREHPAGRAIDRPADHVGAQGDMMQCRVRVPW